MLKISKLKKIKSNFPVIVGQQIISKKVCNSLIKEISNSKNFDDMIMGGRSRINKGSKNFNKYISSSKISKKLFALTAIGPLSAIFDLHHTDLYINNNANDVSRSLGKEIILETREVALADGVNVSEDECLFMFNKIVDSKQTNKSSMAFDVLYKRKTEIDFISGAVSKIGKKHGIATPLNDLMYKMIRVKEGMYS